MSIGWNLFTPFYCHDQREKKKSINTQLERVFPIMPSQRDVIYEADRQVRQVYCSCQVFVPCRLISFTPECSAVVKNKSL